MENWAHIQAEHFKNCVIRGFHTELETVYEEKNMSLTSDRNKVIEKLFAALFLPHHPYGTQTVLGTQDDLKNPSITNIKNFYKQWYVPNNMAICLSGDLDPDQTIAVIDKYFGSLQPNLELPKLRFAAEPPITEPVTGEVYGQEAENVTLAWRFPGAASREEEMLMWCRSWIYNGQAGLFDLDLAQKQKVLSASCFSYPQADYSLLLMERAQNGTGLDEVKDLMLAEVKKLRDGDFDEAMLEASSINNLKLEQLYQLQSNESRADMFVKSFINGSNWSDEVTTIERMAKITKQEVADFANRYLTDASYAPRLQAARH